MSTIVIASWAKMSLMAVASFSALLILLHFLKPELDPSWRMISEYEIGRHGWIMRLAFLCWSASFFALTAALFQQASTVAEVLLAIVGAGTLIAALFAPDPITTRRDSLSRASRLHSIGGMLVIPVLPLAAVVVGWSISGNPLVASIQHYLLWISFLPWFGLAVQAIPVFRFGSTRLEPGPNMHIGWPNRFMVFTYVAWLMIIACALFVPASA
jgi:Protein of unknown function (DUF998)